jgi:GntR family transcriptional regulator
VTRAAGYGELLRTSAVQLYVQIARRLRRVLAEQPITDGPLFTEERLAEQFGVHRMTIRQALGELERDGLIVRQRGVGTFRSPQKLRGEPIYLDSFFDQWALQGRRVAAEVLEITTEPAEGRPAECLDLLDGEMTHIRRLRRVDDRPLVLDHIYLPQATGRALTVADLVSSTLHRAISLRTGKFATDADLEIEATIAATEEATLLEVAEGSPLFLRHIVLRDGLRAPLSYGWSLYRADLYTYTLTVPLDRARAYATKDTDQSG